MTRTTSLSLPAEPPIPCSIEAEVCVLGSMILDVTCIPVVGDILTAEDFYRPAHTTIFTTLANMHSAAKSIDLVLLREELKAQGRLEAVGGVDYLVALAEGVPSATNAQYYAKIVREKAQLRAMVGLGQRMCSEAATATADSTMLLDHFEDELHRMADPSNGQLLRRHPRYLSAVQLLETFPAQREPIILMAIHLTQPAPISGA